MMLAERSSTPKMPEFGIYCPNMAIFGRELASST